jgi:hypothetical protein
LPSIATMAAVSPISIGVRSFSLIQFPESEVLHVPQRNLAEPRIGKDT